MDVYYGCKEWEGLSIEEGEDLRSIVKKILIAERLVLDTDCDSPDLSLLAYIARLLDKEVLWTGEREPRGLLRRLVSGKLATY